MIEELKTGQEILRQVQAVLVEADERLERLRSVPDAETLCRALLETVRKRLPTDGEVNELLRYIEDGASLRKSHQFATCVREDATIFNNQPRGTGTMLMTTDWDDVVSAIRDAVEDTATAEGIVDMLNSMVDGYESQISDQEYHIEELESHLDELELVPRGLEAACSVILSDAGIQHPSAGDVINLAEAVRKILTDRFGISLSNIN